MGLMMAIATLVYKMPRFDVTYWGKLATFLLMFSVPAFLMGNSTMPGADGFPIVAWAIGAPDSCSATGPPSPIFRRCDERSPSGVSCRSSNPYS